MGLGMTLISIMFQAGQFVIEEKILMRYEIPPMRMIGLEGMFGIIFMFFWINVIGRIPCPSESMCSMNGTMEDPIAAFDEIFSNGI